MNWRADAALPASAAPQSSQNADEGAFSAPHFGQRLDSGLPHAAQNFLFVVLSVPHLVQRMRLTLSQSALWLTFATLARRRPSENANTPSSTGLQSMLARLPMRLYVSLQDRVHPRLISSAVGLEPFHDLPDPSAAR